MVTILIEAIVLCGLFTICCMSLVGVTMKNLDSVKLDYPQPIVQRLIEQGRISSERPLSLFERIKKKWPAIIVFGIIEGLLVRYINGCTTFISGFGISYLLWTIVDWYDAFVIDCLWFCHSKRCVIPGTEDLIDAYHDYMFHIKGSCAGMLLGLPCSLIAGFITFLLSL